MMDLLFFPWQLFVIFVGLTAVIAFIALNGLLLVYLDRKVGGFIQRRVGPYEVGPHGILQPVADGLKLLGKQIFTPKGADPVLYWLAPMISITPAIVVFIAIPFGPNLQVINTNVGLILILAFTGINVLALCLGGWASQNKYALLGAARDIAQSVAYEIPLLLSVLPIIFMTGTFNLFDITSGQGAWPWQWYILYQPVAFLIFFVCILAETNRSPFDLPEGESELTAGFHTDYSGMAFALFFLAEYAYMVIGSCLIATIFLGGFQGPIVSGAWWFLAKVYILLLIMIWIRWTFPRLRFDQLLNVCWKWMIPIAVLNLLVTLAVISL